jgi:hypothetical protein
MSDAAARETIEAALAAGLAYFDTAPHYGFGLSETRLGAALPADVKVSTKVGRLLRPAPEVDPTAERHGFVGAAPFEPVFDYSYDGVMRAFEASLRRLKRDHIDVLLAHDLGAVTHGADDAARRRQFFDGGYKAMRACATAAPSTPSAWASTSGRSATRRWTRATSTSSCWPAATPCWSRRRWTASCRAAPPATCRSSSAARSIPACWSRA